CGDGVVDPSEECDNGPANSDIRPNAGRKSCQLPRCGDGVIDAGEGCDDGNAIDGDGCTSRCELEEGWSCPMFQPCVPICGDGKIVGGEECDGTNLGACCGIRTNTSTG